MLLCSLLIIESLRIPPPCLVGHVRYLRPFISSQLLCLRGLVGLCVCLWCLAFDVSSNRSLSADCTVTGSVKGASLERFGDHLRAIFKSFGGHWVAVWAHFGKFGIMLGAMWIFTDSRSSFGRHLGTLLETILHLGGHVVVLMVTVLYGLGDLPRIGQCASRTINTVSECDFACCGIR